VVGVIDNYAGPVEAFLFTGTRVMRLPPLRSGESVSASDINDSGTVVGWATTIRHEPGMPYGLSACLWVAGHAYDLNDLASRDDGWFLTHAAAINNLGQILQLWDLTSTTDEGLFLGDSDNVSLSTLLLRVGDELDTDGDGDADYVLSDFNASSTVTHPLVLGDDGWVYLDVDLTTIGTTTVNQAIIGINTIPEPAALSLLGAAGLLLLRRRRGA